MSLPAASGPIDASVADTTVAWREVSQRLYPFVRGRVATDADADDVTQEVLIRMWQRLDTLQSADRLSAWMYRIARNAITDHHRASSVASRVVSVGDTSGLERADRDTTSPADDMAFELLMRVTNTFIDQLEEPYREALRLTEIEGLSQVEAAGRVGISVSGMKSRVQRGRIKLRERIEDCCVVALDSRKHVTDLAPRTSDCRC